MPDSCDWPASKAPKRLDANQPERLEPLADKRQHVPILSPWSNKAASILHVFSEMISYIPPLCDEHGTFKFVSQRDYGVVPTYSSVTATAEWDSTLPGEWRIKHQGSHEHLIWFEEDLSVGFYIMEEGAIRYEQPIKRSAQFMSHLQLQSGELMRIKLRDTTEERAQALHLSGHHQTIKNHAGMKEAKHSVNLGSHPVLVVILFLKKNAQAYNNLLFLLGVLFVDLLSSLDNPKKRRELWVISPENYNVHTDVHMGTGHWIEGTNAANVTAYAAAAPEVDLWYEGERRNELSILDRPHTIQTPLSLMHWPAMKLSRFAVDTCFCFIATVGIAWVNRSKRLLQYPAPLAAPLITVLVANQFGWAISVKLVCVWGRGDADDGDNLSTSHPPPIPLLPSPIFISHNRSFDIIEELVKICIGLSLFTREGTEGNDKGQRETVDAPDEVGLVVN
ncbi:hypothetical protein BDK51DRAFT_27161 [Blyttiomyces helicus]|uniref:Uncharacterized protein n=1 Tax=Blyttiomyces helicus TaxID=388810 RepID=A0A4P9W5S0_9FUNG|nr:hypothetical protein BDK51DRAFT_27161 [Blyttiomyces helicus]|eukprot:RKO87771.1 hypothetical protein BDK51DRAFT_27161 [Blyttiomyces helicus]